MDSDGGFIKLAGRSYAKMDFYFGLILAVNSQQLAVNSQQYFRTKFEVPLVLGCFFQVSQLLMFKLSEPFMVPSYEPRKKPSYFPLYGLFNRDPSIIPT